MLEDGLEAGTPVAAGPTAEPTKPVEADDEDMMTDKEWITLFRSALKSSSDFQNTKLRTAWSRNYRAFNNRHMNGSKYDTFKYRHRSKLFKPKTRMAVRKNDATAASALFSTAEVVSITAERASDRKQEMTARFIHACLNYRLDRGTKKTGPNWFLTAIGARQDTQLTGICVSKQYWEFEEQEYDAIVDQPAMDANGIPLSDPLTGADITEEVLITEREVCRDRIMVTLLPPEQAFIDPTADWRDPIQEGQYFIAGYPTRKEDVETMISQGATRSKMGGGAWRTDINLKQITSARSAESTQNQNVRRSRDQGVDRYDSIHATDKNSDILWLYECFYRLDGEDWHFWMLGEHIMLSTPRPCRDSYPEQKGDRPYVVGVGTLETHKTHPTAPVESWQPLQQEMNDITNLGLDARKMAISPITKIKRGRNIDFKQVQNRGPDAMIMVEEEDDVTFDRAPGPDGGEQQAVNNLTVDFDELAGVFSTSSVQANRQLNETVGGMNLMSGSANALTEFDLRVWVETWLEPCLRQCVNLIQYYESDETVIAVAGENAGLIVLPGTPKAPPGPMDPQGPEEDAKPDVTLAEVLGELGDAQVSVKVNVGIGALDNKQKLEKFSMGMKMTMEAAPLLDAQGIMPNGPEMMQEVWGLLGYKDAARFYKSKPPPDPNQPPPPEVQKEQISLESRKAEAAGKTQDRQEQMAMEKEKFRWQVEDRQRQEAERMNAAMIKQQQDDDAAFGKEAETMEKDSAMQAIVAEMEAGRQETMAMMQQQNQMFMQAITAMVQAITAPKTVTTPEGRTFTSGPAQAPAQNEEIPQ